jgi:hypothetical protein
MAEINEALPYGSMDSNTTNLSAPSTQRSEPSTGPSEESGEHSAATEEDLENVQA